MALWTDINPAELTAFSRVAQESIDEGVLTTVLPNLTQDEVKFSWRVNQILSEAAEFGEFDTEAPIGSGDKSEEKTMRLLPVSRKLRLSEYEQVTDLDRVRALAEDKADQVVRYVTNRLNRARGEVLVTGKLAISENGVVQNVDFGRKSTHTNAAPTALWSASGADPIADLRKWADMIADESGVVPDVLAGATRVYSALASALADAGYVTTGAGVVSRSAVSEILASYGLPAFTVFDGRVGGQRIVADDKLVLAASGGVSGSTVFAPTVESTDPRYNLAPSDRSGIIAGVYSEDDPPVKWVLGKAVALPVLSNPDTTLSADVL